MNNRGKPVLVIFQRFFKSYLGISRMTLCAKQIKQSRISYSHHLQRCIRNYEPHNNFYFDQLKRAQNIEITMTRLMKVFDCMSPDSLIMILVVSGVEKNDHRGLLAPFLRKAPLYFGYPLFQVLFHSIKCLCYSKITLFQKTYI